MEDILGLSIEKSRIKAKTKVQNTELSTLSFLPLEAALGSFVACYTGGILNSAENKNLT